MSNWEKERETENGQSLLMICRRKTKRKKEELAHQNTQRFTCTTYKCTRRRVCVVANFRYGHRDVNCLIGLQYNTHTHAHRHIHVERNYGAIHSILQLSIWYTARACTVLRYVTCTHDIIDSGASNGEEPSPVLNINHFLCVYGYWTSDHWIPNAVYSVIECGTCDGRKIVFC